MRWLVLYVLLMSCAHQTPVYVPPDVDRPQDTIDAACRRAEAGEVISSPSVLCELEPFLTARDSVIDQWAAEAECRVLLERERKHHVIDDAVNAGQLQRLTEQRDAARHDRWIWGAVGTGLGVVVSVIIFLAAGQ